MSTMCISVCSKMPSIFDTMRPWWIHQQDIYKFIFWYCTCTPPTHSLCMIVRLHSHACRRRNHAGRTPFILCDTHVSMCAVIACRIGQQWCRPLWEYAVSVFCFNRGRVQFIPACAVSLNPQSLGAFLLLMWRPGMIITCTQRIHHPFLISQRGGDIIIQRCHSVFALFLIFHSYY